MTVHYIGDSLDESLTAEAIELFEEIPTTIARRSPSPSRAAQMRSLSPVRGRSPAVADNTLAMVQSAIHKRGLQVQVINHSRTKAVFADLSCNQFVSVENESSCGGCQRRSQRE